MSTADLSHLPVYESNATPEQQADKRVFVRNQIKHLVTAPPEFQILLTCECGRRVVHWMMYRCLYCGVYYCKTCAQLHFGQRVPGAIKEPTS